MSAKYSLEALSLPYYDGAGNDFFLYDERIHGICADYPELARAACDRHGMYGGADGILLIGATTDAACDVRMRIFNADGSEAEMCGNGARCAVRYLLEAEGEHVTLETLAGPILGSVLSRGNPFVVGADLGWPGFLAADLAVRAADLPDDTPLVDIPFTVDDAVYRFDGISFGNPHIVLFVDDVAACDIANLGPKLERAPIFSHGTNVHFVSVVDERTLRVRHWERGSGATLACGTGAAASAVAAIRRGYVSSPVRVLVPGGELNLAWQGGAAVLSGPVHRHAAEGRR
jgi:diaminopimelate epimerase